MITYEELNSMEIINQVDYINKLLIEGMTIITISEAMSINKETITKKFKKFGYARNRKLNQFIQEGEKVEAIKSHIEPTENTSNTNTLEAKIKALEGRIKALENAINTINTNTINPGNTINTNTNNTTNTKLEIKLLEGNTVSRVYRLNEAIQQEFKVFCKKHYEHTQQDLLNNALIEFMNKYK